MDGSAASSAARRSRPESPAGFAIVDRNGVLMRLAWRAFLDQVAGDVALRGHYLELLSRAASEFTAKKLLVRCSSAATTGSGSSHVIARATTSTRAVAALADELGVDESDTVDRRVPLFHDARWVERFERVLAALASGPDRKQRARTAPLPRRACAVRSMRTISTTCAPRSSSSNRVRRVRRRRPCGPHSAVSTTGAIGSCSMDLHAVRDALHRGVDPHAERDRFAVDRAAFHCADASDQRIRHDQARTASLDFDDLEWHAAELMNDDAHAAYVQARLDARYRHILVDEFQDTNPLQWEVLRRWLTAYAEDASMRDDRPSIFLVGDPKQSIYRFRRAEPRLFETASTFLRDRYGASLLSTHETRRVAPDLMELLNASFACDDFRLFHRHRSVSSTSGGAAWRLPLIPRNAKKAEAVDAYGGANAAPRRADQPRADEPENAHDLEARHIVDVLSTLIERGTIVRDGGSDENSRSARWSDVLVLVRTREYIASLEDAFRNARIPYSSVRSGGLLSTLEADDLSAVAGAGRAVLGSVAGAGAALAALRLHRRRPDPLAGLPDAEHPHWWSRMQAVAEADADGSDRSRMPAACCSRGAMRRRPSPAHDLLDRIVHEGRVRSSAPWRPPCRRCARRCARTCMPISRSRWPRTAVAFEAFRDSSTSCRTLARLDADAPDEGQADAAHAETADDLDEAPDDAADAAAPFDPIRDRVRIMTVHAAKGLEAPIVVIADAYRRKRSQQSNDVLIAWPPDSDAPLHFSIFGRAESRGAARDRHFGDEDRAAAAEDWNVLYVAATRARQLLIVSGCKPQGENPDSWYERLQHCRRGPATSGGIGAMRRRCERRRWP